MKYGENNMYTKNNIPSEHQYPNISMLHSHARTKCFNSFWTVQAYKQHKEISNHLMMHIWSITVTSTLAIHAGHEIKEFF